MRKLFSLLMVLAMVIGCVPALAETPDAEYTAYTHETLGYTLEYPAAWQVLDAGTVDAVMDMIASGNMEIPGMDETSISALKDQIQNLQMSIWMDTATGNNINVAVQNVGMALTNDLFLQLLAPQMLAQFQTMMPDAVMVDEGSLYEVGDNSFVSMSLKPSADSNQLMGQFFYFSDTNMYVITLTIVIPEEEEDYNKLDALIDHVLASFAVPAA